MPPLPLKDRLDALRHEAHTPPSPERWSRLILLLHDWPHDEALEVALPYLTPLLQDDPTPRRAAGAWFTLRGGFKPTHPAWTLARSLDLQSASLRDADIKALAASPHLNNLTALNLNNNRLGTQGVKALVVSPHLKNLTALHLVSNRLKAKAIQHLLAAPWLDQLTALHLDDNHLDDAAVAALAACPRLAQLTELTLSLNNFGAEGATALVASPYLPESTRRSWRYLLR